MEDSQIIALYWRRDEGAIIRTAEKYGGYCKHIAFNILSSAEEADECVNDTYFHAWNAIPPAMPNLFRAWLGKIARNLSLDRYKSAHAQKRGGHQVVQLFSELENCLPDQSDPHQEMEDRVLAGLISDFLRRRPQESRLLFVRRYYYGDTLAQIAQRYGISEGKVKSSLFRTRSALRQFLEKAGICL